jgi:hypothetical protein
MRASSPSPSAMLQSRRSRSLMAARRRVPIPLIVVLVGALGVLIVLNREVPPRRISAALATTSLQTPIRDFASAWSLAERVLAEKDVRFTLRTFVVAVPSDRARPPRSMYLAFRSVSDDNDFSIRIDNSDLEMVVSATFPTPPELRSLGVPEPIEPGAVQVTLARALVLADSMLAEHEAAPGVSTDVVLRTHGGILEWRVSYVGSGEAGRESLLTVVLNAGDGTVIGDAAARKPGDGA